MLNINNKSKCVSELAAAAYVHQKKKHLNFFFFFLTNVLSCVKVTLHQQGNISKYPSSGSNPSGTCPEHHFRAISQGTLTRTLKQASTPVLSFFNLHVL